MQVSRHSQGSLQLAPATILNYGYDENCVRRSAPRVVNSPEILGLNWDRKEFGNKSCRNTLSPIETRLDSPKITVNHCFRKSWWTMTRSMSFLASVLAVVAVGGFSVNPVEAA